MEQKVSNTNCDKVSKDLSLAALNIIEKRLRRQHKDVEYKSSFANNSTATRNYLIGKNNEIVDILNLIGDLKVLINGDQIDVIMDAGGK